MDHSRRDFISIASITGLAALITATAARAQAPAATAGCVAPKNLSLSQKNRRRSIGYMDMSDDPAKQCSKCSFFTASQSGCGSCVMLSGGPVSASGLCSSYSPRG